MDDSPHRFFVPPEWLEGSRAQLKEQVARQVSRVLRMAPGDKIILLDNSGLEYLTELGTFHRDHIDGRIVSKTVGCGEPKTHLTLYQSLLKGDKLDWVLQKGTELGATAFVPLVSRRSVPRPNKGEQQLARSRRIVAEAAEQSGRALLPQVCPAMALSEALQQLPQGLALMPYENEHGFFMKEALQASSGQADQVSLFIGPEGGWDPEEVALASSHGVVPVSLGQRILRAETAAVAAMTIAMYSQGEVGE